MEPQHLRTLARARSLVAALADGAQTVEASSGYERVLIELDRVHGDESPALDTRGLSTDRGVLLAEATSTIEELAEHGVDALDIELVLALLTDAHFLDVN